MSRRFFDDERNKLLDSLITDKDQLAIIKQLHRNFNVILRIISSKGRQIDVDIFSNLCTNTYIDILIHLAWADLTPTAHKILAHSAELVKNNSCLGVGHLSEEGLEAQHKIIRKFRASWTLQSSDDANLKDLIKKMFLISDPLFYSFRRTIKCSKCGLLGHNRKCPGNAEVSNKSESDILVEGIFIDE